MSRERSPALPQPSHSQNVSGEVKESSHATAASAGNFDGGKVPPTISARTPHAFATYGHFRRPGGHDSAVAVIPAPTATYATPTHTAKRAISPCPPTHLLYGNAHTRFSPAFSAQQPTDPEFTYRDGEFSPPEVPPGREGTNTAASTLSASINSLTMSTKKPC